jgi:hypothetical protein
MVSFAHSFGSYSTWLASSIVFITMIRQNVITASISGAKLLTSWWPGKQEEVGTLYNHEKHACNDLLPPTRHSLLITHSV